MSINSIKLKADNLFRQTLTAISPKLNTEVCYRVKFGRKLNMVNPATFNEKVLYLKFHDYKDNELVRQCADKYRVRNYIKKIGFEEILNDIYGVYDNANNIPLEGDILPDKFAIKLNVGSGYNMIVTDKKSLDRDKVVKQLSKWFHAKPWLGYSEMQYKGVKPVLIVEKYLGEADNTPPVDYKFYCYDGRAEYVMLCVNRDIHGKHALYCCFDRNFNRVEKFSKSSDGKLGDLKDIKKPVLLDKAFEYADKLSKGFPFVRTDLYIVDGKIYFSEYTFTPCGGMDTDYYEQTDRLLGEKIILK